MALHRIGQLPRALQALKVAVAQNSNFPEAHRRLAYIYRKRLMMLQKADEYLALAREAAARIRGLKKGRIPETVSDAPEPEPVPKTASTGGLFPDGMPAETESVDLANTVIIVSGLPRSGTSMMMQMLEAGGILPLTDDKRPPDDDNPKGYFEYEPVKRLGRDASWLPQAKGKAVKIMAPLLPGLRPDLSYRVIFMTRPMEKILRSQALMLEHRGETGGDLSDDRMAEVFTVQTRQARELLKHRRIPFLVVDYSKAVKEPGKTAEGVNRFLGGGLNETAMADAVDAGLRRQGV